MHFFSDFIDKFGFFLTLTILYYLLTLAHLIRISICALLTLALTWTPICKTRTMSSNKKCCVPNCKEPPGSVLHKFPNPDHDMERFRTWIYAIGGDILGLENQFIYKYRRVCHSHFEVNFMTRSRRLSNIAVPTLRLSNFRVVTSRTPLQNITNRDENMTDKHTDLTLSTTSKDIHHIERNVENLETSTSKGMRVDKVFQRDAMSFMKQIKKLKISKDKYVTRLKKALKLNENTTFKKAMQKFTTLAALFTLMQFREASKPKMGRRFTQNEKIMALSLYKQGPKAYRWLRKVFVLPSPVTLSRIISRACLKPGINENLFAQLKKKAKNMKQDEKLCILLFDEMLLTAHFDYNKKKDKITGFVDNGQETTSKIADHALVFMLRGAIHNYKQPLSYTFCSGSTSSAELVTQIKNIIRKLTQCGLKVIATVCDQGASNVSAINFLIKEAQAKFARNRQEFRNNCFEVDGEEIVPLFDPPHLLKGIRNNLLNKNLKYKSENKEKVAKWNHVLKLYDENPAYKGIRLMKNLTEDHVNPRKINKMKVKYASQVLSETVGVNMGYMADKGILPEEVRDTADIILFFDKIFDSLNGSYDNSKKRRGKELLGPVTPRSKHHSVWNDAKKIFKSMKFITSEGREAHVPSINNWLKTVENVQYLTRKLTQKYKINSIWLRHFNQDPLENFFGCVRSHGYRNISPTCAGFEAAFASLLINNLSSNHSPGSNCEEDTCKVYKSINKIFLIKTPIMDNNTTELDLLDMDENIIVDYNLKKHNPKISAELQYVTGYVLRKGKKIIFKNCKECKSCLYDPTCASNYIRIREYNKDGKTCLSYPSNALVECFSIIQDLTINILCNKSQMDKIKSYIKTVLYVMINFNFIKCKQHKKELIEYIFDLSTRFFLCNWCRDINKLLNGTRTDFNNDDKIQKMAIEYNKKRQKKK